jgi:CO/xanthine dehydrogenase FAD-binding subunit
MIIEYHRPDTLQEALELLSREGMKTLPMGGGTVLNRPSSESYAVVDLQSLGLDRIQAQGKTLVIGATATLRDLGEWSELQADLQRAIRLEVNYNLRGVATVAGALVSAHGRSPFSVAMLAMEAHLVTIGLDDEKGFQEHEVGLGDLLPLRSEKLARRLVIRVSVPLNVRLKYEQVARTPADWPILALAAAQWPSGRTRIAVGGFGDAPRLALDGPHPTGAGAAVRNALKHSADQWASAEYRQESAVVLTRRILSSFSAEQSQE